MKNFLKKINLDYKFGLIIFIIGLIFSILMPIYQVPDEPTHLQMIYDELNQNINIYEVYGDIHETFDLMGVEKPKINYKKYFDFSNRITERLELKVPQVTVLRHLPQALAVPIIHLFNLNTFVSLFIMELFSIVFYSILCMISIKLLPLKKNLMKTIMLLPICIQQAGSLSYDAVLLSSSFLFISYILYLKFNKNKVGIKELLIGLIILAVITICKLPYALFGLLFIMLIDKIEIKSKKEIYNLEFIKKHLYETIVALIIIILLGFIICNYNGFSRTLLAFILSPKEFLSVEIITIKQQIVHLVYTATGSLSWFNVKLNNIYCILLIVMLFINLFYSEEKINISKPLRILALIIAIVFTGLISISLYPWCVDVVYNLGNIIDLSLKDIIAFIKEHSNLVVLGLQGRYYIPFIFLLGITFNSEKITNLLNKIKFNYINIIFWCVSYIYIFKVLITSFWI